MRTGDKRKPGRLTRAWCRVRGHRWQTVWPATHASTCLVCLRCHENAWWLT